MITKNNCFNFLQKSTSFFIIFALVTFTYLPLFSKVANAAALTVLSDTMSRQKASTASSQVIRFTVATTMTASQTITVTWPTDFTNTAAVFGDVSMTYGASGTNTTCTIAASPTSGQTCGAVWSTTGNRLLTLTMPSATWTTPIIATNIVIITIASTHELNPTTTGSFTIALATSAGDSASLAVAIVAGTAADENVVVTATVDPTITFTNDDAAIGFGTLVTANARYATANAAGSGSDSVANTLVVATNAASGYTLTYSGATLTAGTTIAAATITSDADGTPATSQFALGTALTGSGTVASGYNHATPDWKFVAGATTTLGSHTAAVSGDSYAMHYLANISASQAPGSYTTTITYIATGNF